jgi:hypothetical protein
MNVEAVRGARNAAVGWSQWAYWCSLACSLLAVSYIPAGSIRTFVIITPVLTAGLCVAATFWLYEACDEYQRVRLLRAVARTAALVAAATLVWFFFELAGYPKLSMLWVNLAGWSLFNLQVLFLTRRER